MTTPENWMIIAGFLFLVFRLERLGKQLEAVSVQIREELVPDRERAEEIIREWKEDQKQARKETRQTFIVWGVIAAAFLAWKFLAQG
jgi:hypothetical protein